MKKDTGGPAFPITVRRDEKYMDEAGYGRVRAVQGLEGGTTLRDYFAAKALIGLVFADAKQVFPAKVIAKEAYELADAMLKERDK